MHLQQQQQLEDLVAERHELSKKRFFENLARRGSTKKVDDLASAALEPNNYGYENDARQSKPTINSQQTVTIVTEDSNGYKKLSKSECRRSWLLDCGDYPTPTLIVENQNYASIVKSHDPEHLVDAFKIELNDDNEDASDLKSYADIVLEKDELTLRDYVNLPPSQTQRTAGAVEYATVRNTMILNDHDQSHICEQLSAHQGRYNQYERPQRRSNGSTSGVSIGEQSSLVSNSDSTDSGGFSTLPPMKLDCPSEHKIESPGLPPRMEAIESGYSQRTKSSLFRRFGSLVSKAFAGGSDLQCSVPTSYSTAGAKRTATSKISEQQEKLRLQESSEQQVVGNEKILHPNQENNNLVAAPSPSLQATEDAPNAADDAATGKLSKSLVIERTEQHQREESARRHELPLVEHEADLIILPAKCVNQRTQVKSQAERIQLQCNNYQHHRNQTATNLIKACRRNGKLSRNRKRSKTRNHVQQSAQRRPHHMIDVSSISGSISSSSSSISISSTSRSCTTSPDSGHHRTTDSSRPVKTNSLSEELESLMSKSSDASNTSSHLAQRKHHNLRQRVDSSVIVGPLTTELNHPSQQSRVLHESPAGKMREQSTAKLIDKLDTTGGKDSSIAYGETDLATLQRPETEKSHSATNGRKSSLLRLFNSASPSIRRTIDSTPNLTDCSSPMGSSQNFAANYSDQVNGSKSSDSTGTKKKQRKIKHQLQHSTHSMGGFWGLASLMDAAHASGNRPVDRSGSTGDKTSRSSKSRTTASKSSSLSSAAATGDELKNDVVIDYNDNFEAERKNSTSNKKNPTAVRRPKLSGHEMLMNDYSNDKKYDSSATGAYSSLAHPEVNDKDLKAQGKCQSLNLYQNLLRNYVKRSHRDGSSHNRHGYQHASRHSSHRHYHHNHHHQHHHDQQQPHHRIHRSSDPHDHTHSRARSFGRTSCQLSDCTDAESLAPRGGSGKNCRKHAHVWGQLIKISKTDGSQVVEIHRTPGKSWGFFVARGTINNQRGIFISRMHDAATTDALTGLLSIGDCILAIDDCLIEQDYDILRVNQLISRKSKIVLRVKPYKA